MAVVMGLPPLCTVFTSSMVFSCHTPASSRHTTCHPFSSSRMVVTVSSSMPDIVPSHVALRASISPT